MSIRGNIVAEFDPVFVTGSVGFNRYLHFDSSNKFGKYYFDELDVPPSPHGIDHWIP